MSPARARLPLRFQRSVLLKLSRKTWYRWFIVILLYALFNARPRQRNISSFTHFLCANLCVALAVFIPLCSFRIVSWAFVEPNKKKRKRIQTCHCTTWKCSLVNTPFTNILIDEPWWITKNENPNKWKQKIKKCQTNWNCNLNDKRRGPNERTQVSFQLKQINR